jgi:TPR repeat protein
MDRRFLRSILVAAGLTTIWAAPPAMAMSSEMDQQAVEFQRQQNWTALASLAARATAADPRDSAAWFDAGIAADGLGRKADAIKAYETALPLVSPYLRGSVIQLLAQDYVALNQPDRVVALYRQIESAQPEIARSLRQQYAAILDKALPPPPQASLPDISPASVGALTAELRHSWQPDAVAVMATVDWLGNGLGFQTVVDFYSPATRTGMAVLPGAAGEKRMPTNDPRWGTVPLPADFLSLATALTRTPGNAAAVNLQHAFLYRKSDDPSKPTDLIWTIALKNAGPGADATVIPAYVMSKDVFDRLVVAAERGDVRSQYSLALAYATGIAGVVDRRQSATWLAKAANQGDAEAQNKLGQYYQFGIGEDVNAKTAADWYQKAANAGNADGQFNLGLLYETGLGVPHQDWIQADRWVSAAAAQHLQAAYQELSMVRQTAKREQHRQELAAMQSGAAGAHCPPGQAYVANSLVHCGPNYAVLNHLMNVAVHPELPPNKVM